MGLEECLMQHMSMLSQMQRRETQDTLEETESEGDKENPREEKETDPTRN